MIDPWCDTPMHEGCGGPLVTRAEHHRGEEYATDVRLCCLGCGDGVAGSDTDVAKATAAAEAWEQRQLDDATRADELQGEADADTRERAAEDVTRGRIER